jgi:transcriptional regulator with XRE-family HTH domain
MPLPREISSVRAQLGLSQAELAQHLGVNQTTVSRWERGLEKPGVRVRVNLSGLLYRLRVPGRLSPEIALCEYSPFPMAIISQDWSIVALSEVLRKASEAPLKPLTGTRKRSTADMEQAVSMLRARGFFTGQVSAARILGRGFLLGPDPKPFEALCTPVMVDGRICRLMQYAFLTESEFRIESTHKQLVTFLGETQGETK